jgi:hypothetical protein
MVANPFRKFEHFPEIRAHRSRQNFNRKTSAEEFLLTPSLVLFGMVDGVSPLGFKPTGPISPKTISALK